MRRGAAISRLSLNAKWNRRREPLTEYWWCAAAGEYEIPFAFKGKVTDVKMNGAKKF